MGFWIDTFVDEKGYDLTEPLGDKNVPLGEVVAAIKRLQPNHREFLKKSIIKMDFHDPEAPKRLFRVMADELFD